MYKLSSAVLYRFISGFFPQKAGVSGTACVKPRIKRRYGGEALVYSHYTRHLSVYRERFYSAACLSGAVCKLKYYGQNGIEYVFGVFVYGIRVRPYQLRGTKRLAD